MVTLSVLTVVDDYGAASSERWPLTLDQAAVFTTSASSMDVMSDTMAGVDPVVHPKLNEGKFVRNGFFELDDGSNENT